MTNYEYYKEQIERFARMGQKVAVKKTRMKSFLALI